VALTANGSLSVKCTCVSIAFLLSGVVVLLIHAQSIPHDSAGPTVYKNSKAAVEQRVEDLLRRMTTEEKAVMLAGSGWMETQPNERLGIPSLKMADGPLGTC